MTDPPVGGLRVRGRWSESSESSTSLRSAVHLQLETIVPQCARREPACSGRGPHRQRGCRLLPRHSRSLSLRLCTHLSVAPSESSAPAASPGAVAASQLLRVSGAQCHRATGTAGNACAPSAAEAGRGGSPLTSRAGLLVQVVGAAGCWRRAACSSTGVPRPPRHWQ